MTSSRLRSGYVGLVLLAAVAGLPACASTRAASPHTASVHVGSAPTPSALAEADWPAAHTESQQALARHEFGRADSVLRAFAARYPGTGAASETVYWRALLRLDPAAEGAGSRDYVREARTGFDTYLAGGPSLPHYAEASTMRRVAAHLDSLQSATVEAVHSVLGTQAARDSARARDDETARLRTELEQTKAALERLRKRLAPPRP